MTSALAARAGWMVAVLVFLLLTAHQIRGDQRQEERDRAREVRDRSRAAFRVSLCAGMCGSAVVVVCAEAAGPPKVAVVCARPREELGASALLEAFVISWPEEEGVFP